MIWILDLVDCHDSEVCLFFYTQTIMILENALIQPNANA